MRNNAFICQGVSYTFSEVLAMFRERIRGKRDQKYCYNMHQPLHRIWGGSCHAECNEASLPACEILRYAQDDKRGGSSG
jgi:hypothetical protein